MNGVVLKNAVEDSRSGLIYLPAATACPVALPINSILSGDSFKVAWCASRNVREESGTMLVQPHGGDQSASDMPMLHQELL
jgi:hypothetical protein